MSAPFIPDEGTLFYVSARPFKRVVNEGGGFGLAEKVIEQTDNSYSGDVMRCLGADGHAVVGTPVTQSYLSGEKMVFPVWRWAFAPVGPGVAAALGLANNGDEAT